jgi:hypothetical protein
MSAPANPENYPGSMARCSHSVFRCFDDPTGRSSCCELCNSGCKPKPMLSQKQLAKAIRQIEKVVPPIDEDPEIKETASAEIDEESFEEDPRELGESAETDFEIEEEPQAERETADVEG